MRIFAIALMAGLVGGVAQGALADDSTDTTGEVRVVALDDTAFDAQFQCPETITDPDARIDAFARYTEWARQQHPDWNLRKRLDVRYGLLRRHACAVTLAKLAESHRAPFAP